MHIFYQARKVPTHNVDARGTRRLISEQCDSLESAGTVQLPARPSNPYFLQLAAHCLSIPCWHAILPRVCQSKSPPIHFSGSRRSPSPSHPSPLRKNRHCNSFSSCQLQMPPGANPFLAHPYKCPGGMGVNTSILKVLLELFLLSTHFSVQKAVLQILCFLLAAHSSKFRIL